MAKKCPHPYGVEVSIPLTQLEIDEATNMRGERETASLRTLAASIKAVTQIHPILVMWTGTGYAVVAGFRRALAMLHGREAHGFKTIKVKVVKSDNAEVLRLAENFERENPTTFETCRYVHELISGENGRAKVPAAEVAESIGRSRKYVQNLARFYRALPGDIRALWASDRDGVFSFRVLNELATFAASNLGDDDALRARLTMLLTGEDPRKEPAPKSQASASDDASADDGEESGDAEGEGEGEAPAPMRKLGRPGSKKLARRLEAAGPIIVQSDERAILVGDLLRVFAGELPAARAAEIVEMLLKDLGGGAEAPRAA